MKYNVLLIGFVIGLMVVVAGCSSGDNDDADSITSDQKLELAKCLTQKGIKMYGASWCSHCQAQKAAFGDAFSSVQYVDCELEKQKCIDAGIQYFPTWIIDGELHVGEQDFDTLQSLSGCTVE